MFRWLIIFIFLIDKSTCCQGNITDIENLDFQLKLEPNCTYFLPIYPEKSIKLTLDCHAELDFWLIVNVNNVEHSIFHSNFSSECSRSEINQIPWQTPKNTGLKIFVRSKIDTDAHVKIGDTEETCSFPYIQLDHNSTMIQKDVTFSMSQDCVYRLVPKSNDYFNEIKIEFNIESELQFEKRIYRDSENFETRIYTSNKKFLLEPFDLKMQSYFQTPEITATLHHNQCVDGIHEMKIGSENITTIIELPYEWADKCDPQMKSIYKLEFLNMEQNEIVVFENNFKNVEDVFMELSQLHDRKILMNRTHWMSTSALNTTGLYFELTNEHSIDEYVLKFTRIKIADDCKCSTFDEIIYDQSKHFDLKFPKHCRNIFCHWAITNHESKKVINLRVSVDSPSPTDFVEENFSYLEKRQRRATMLIDTPHVPKVPQPEIAFYRFNQTSEVETTIHISWDFSLHCECPTSSYILRENDEVNVTSQNWPDVYCKNLRCLLSVTTVDSADLIISINQFHVDSEGDHLSIYNDSSTYYDEKLLEMMTGEKSRGDFEMGSVASFLFESNHKMTPDDKGYHITIRSRLRVSTTTSTAEPTTSTESSSSLSTTKSITTTTELTTTTKPIIISTQKTFATTFTKSLDPSYHSSTFAIMSFLFAAILLVVVGFLYQQRNLRRQTQRMLFSADPPSSLNMQHNSLY